MHGTTNLDSPEDLKYHPAWLRLEDQLQWYERKSTWNQKWYKSLRISQLILAATIPVIALSGVEWSKWVTAVFGALIAILEGTQQLNQFGPQWIEYRSNAEGLRSEKFLFLSQSGHYRNIDHCEALHILAERVEEKVSQEHARWTSTSGQALKEKNN
jgi:hypothetical protein